MNLSLTDRQRDIAEAATRLLAELQRADPVGRRRLPEGYDRSAWQRVLALGWPHSLAGNDRDLLSTAVAMAEALGRGPLKVPLHSGLVQPVLALSAAGGPAAEVLLGSITSGQRHVAFAGSLTLSTSRTARGRWRLIGGVPHVPFAADVETFLVVATTGMNAASLFAVPADTQGISLVAVPTMVRDQRHHLRLEGVELPAEALIGRKGCAATWLPSLLDSAAVVVAAEMVGAASAALGAARDHACARRQFGAAVATFQSVAHRLADTLIDLHLARDAVYDAAAAIERGDSPDGGRVKAAEAKAFAAECCSRIVASAHQIRGGEGILTSEPFHLWYRTVSSLAAMLGSARAQREIVVTRALNGTDVTGETFVTK